MAQGFWGAKHRNGAVLDARLDDAQSLSEMTRRIDVEEYRSSWGLSLSVLGNCAYKGVVPIDAITRYAVIHPTKAQALCSAALEPTITIQNYQIMGDYYRSLVGHIFDGSPIEEAFPLPADFDPVFTAQREEYRRVLQAERANGGVEVVGVRKASR